MTFIMATNNQNKLNEMKRIFEKFNIDVKTAKQMGFEIGEIEETGQTFEENAKIKAMTTCEITGIPSIGDDTGLIVDELNGEPGVYSARYAGENATYKENYELLLKNLEGVPAERRKARFVTTIYCAFPGKDIKPIVVKGECEGSISFEPSGEDGFGYDPVFLPDEYKGKKTFAQLTPSQKDEISHRGKALRLFIIELEKFLKENKNVDK